VHSETVHSAHVGATIIILNDFNSLLNMEKCRSRLQS